MKTNSLMVVGSFYQLKKQISSRCLNPLRGPRAIALETLKMFQCLHSSAREKPYVSFLASRLYHLVLQWIWKCSHFIWIIHVACPKAKFRFERETSEHARIINIYSFYWAIHSSGTFSSKAPSLDDVLKCRFPFVLFSWHEPNRYKHSGRSNVLKNPTATGKLCLRRKKGGKVALGWPWLTLTWNFLGGLKWSKARLKAFIFSHIFLQTEALFFLFTPPSTLPCAPSSPKCRWMAFNSLGKRLK